jgi:uncharacterized protein YdeI (BOF family)
MQRIYRLFALLLAVGFVAVGCDSGSGIPDDLGEGTTISFERSALSAPEDTGSVSFDIIVDDPGHKEFTVELVRTGGTVNPGDVDAPETTTITFPQSSTSGQAFPYTIEVTDDDLFNEGEETVTYELQNPSDASLGETTSFTFTVEENDVADDPQTIDNARSQSLGAMVTVRGVITRKEGSNVFIQDESGPTGASGIVVRDESENGVAESYDAGDLQPGDEIQVTGELGAFSGLLQVVGTEEMDVTYIRIERDADALPPAQSVTVDELINNGEDYESERIEITGLSIDPDGDTEFGSNANYDATDASTAASITLRVTDDSFYAGEPIPTTAVTFTGVLGQFNFGFGGAREPDTGYQLLPLVEGDLE